uniref:Uncharacterized protein n=1 Tax=Anguilla anguilla TaxID=7936 RepID=A0A0E9S8T5_ANGAN
MHRSMKMTVLAWHGHIFGSVAHAKEGLTEETHPCQ